MTSVARDTLQLIFDYRPFWIYIVIKGRKWDIFRRAWRGNTQSHHWCDTQFIHANRGMWNIKIIALMTTIALLLKIKCNECFKMSEYFLQSNAGNINNIVQWICLQHQQLKQYPLLQTEVYVKSLLDRVHSFSIVFCQFMLNILYLPGLSVSLLLGTDHEKKKKILQQELQLDYKYFVAAVWWFIWQQSFRHVSLSCLCVAFSWLTILSLSVILFLQKKGQKTSEPCPQPQGLSLPIDEKIGVQVCVCVFLCLGTLLSKMLSLYICVWVCHKEEAFHCH